jgi:hypothetical protein
MIPKYFFSLFKSIQRIEEYLHIKFDESGFNPEEIQSLNELSKEILIVTPRKTDNLLEIKGLYIPKSEPHDDLGIKEVCLLHSLLAQLLIYILD